MATKLFRRTCCNCGNKFDSPNRAAEVRCEDCTRMHFEQKEHEAKWWKEFSEVQKYVRQLERQTA